MNCVAMCYFCSDVTIVFLMFSNYLMKSLTGSLHSLLVGEYLFTEFIKTVRATVIFLNVDVTKYLSVQTERQHSFACSLGRSSNILVALPQQKHCT